MEAPINLNNEVNCIINTLLSLNQVYGKIDYNANQDLFQRIGTLANVTYYFSYTGDHETALLGLTKLKNRIVDFSVHFQKAGSGEVKDLALKIDQMKNLIINAEKIINEKVVPTYQLAGAGPEGILIGSVFKDLKKTCLNYLPPSDLPQPLPNEHIKSDFIQPIVKKVKTENSENESKLDFLKFYFESITELDNSKVQLEIELKKLSNLKEEKLNEIDDNNDENQTKKLEAEYEQLKFLKKIISNEFSDVKTSLDIKKAKLQHLLNRQDTPTHHLLKLASLEIEKLES